MQQLLADTAPQLQPVALTRLRCENKGIVNPARVLGAERKDFLGKRCELPECNLKLSLSFSFFFFFFLRPASRLFENCVSLVLWGGSTL